MRWESGGDEDRRVEEKGAGGEGGGGLLKHSGIPASQRKEINGVCLFVTEALCAKRPLTKYTPHIWHERGATIPLSTVSLCSCGIRKFLSAKLCVTCC